MTLIKKGAKGKFLPSLHSNLTEVFDLDKFFKEPFFESPIWNRSNFIRVPATNIMEKDNEFVIELAAPGMDKKDFHIDIMDNMLEIKVEKEEEFKKDMPNYTRREFDYSAFFRSFNLPEGVNAEKIKAEYNNGMLFVHLPKVPSTQRKPVKEIAVM
jgi:HSP20 family protein